MRKTLNEGSNYEQTLNEGFNYEQTLNEGFINNEDPPPLDLFVSRLVQHFEKVFIDQKSIDSCLASRIVSLFPKNKIFFIDEKETTPTSSSKGFLSQQEFDQSKRQLYIKYFEGQFLKRCPGVHQKIAINCCNYYVLNLGQQCHFDCSYCYLQGYLNQPYTYLFSNINKALDEIDLLYSQHSHLPFRIGTGEIMDSLGLDPLCLYAYNLIHLFSNKPNWILELKTKTDSVDHLLNLNHSGNVIISWSLNTPRLITSEERGTPSLKQRLEAAQKCIQSNYKIAFHFDPLIWYPEWKEEYDDVFSQIQKLFNPEHVFSISAGALRFHPDQRHLMRERFGMKSYVTSSEVFLSSEGKMRYDFLRRQEMFSFFIRKFKSHNSRWNLTLCMEPPESWKSSFEKMPLEIPELKSLFRPLPRNNPL